jgi:hypothetical protein
MDRWSGKPYQLETNHLKFETVAIKFNDRRSTLIVRDERGEHPIQAGFRTWLKDTTDLRGYDGEPVAATGAWIAEDTYEIRVCYYHSQFCPVFRLHYVDGELKLEVEPNVSWSAPTMTTITGRVAENAI